MADVFSNDKRSEVMRRVKSSGNLSTEGRLLAFFKANRVTGWRRAYPLFGKPDFVFPKLRVAIFADGCFWHGHDCRNTRPSDNKAFWDAKRAKNQARDLNVTETLTQKGWRVVRIWECDLKKGRYEADLLAILKPASAG